MIFGRPHHPQADPLWAPKSLIRGPLCDPYFFWWPPRVWEKGGTEYFLANEICKSWRFAPRAFSASLYPSFWDERAEPGPGKREWAGEAGKSDIDPRKILDGNAPLRESSKPIGSDQYILKPLSPFASTDAFPRPVSRKARQKHPFSNAPSYPSSTGLQVAAAPRASTATPIYNAVLGQASHRMKPSWEVVFNWVCISYITLHSTTKS